MAHDRTRTALSRQLNGLRLSHFEVTMKGPDRTTVEVLSQEQILGSLDRLKRANLAGCHIYVRGPRDRDHDLVLLDDIQPFTPRQMQTEGHDAAVVVQTSPGSVQAWMRLGRPVSPAIRHEVARFLAGRYGGDAAAVNPHQAGRLAGFTNRKPEYRGPSGYPFVLLLNAPGCVATKADQLISEAQETAVRAQSRVSELAAALHVSAASDPHQDLVGAWRALYAQRAGSDLSAVDWAVVNQGLGMGVDPDTLASALAEVADRKGRHAQSYAELTLRSAIRRRP
jgi:hypothetical protein